MVVFLLHSGWSFSRCFVFPQFLGVVVFPLLSGWSFSHCCQGGRFPTVVRVAVFLLLSMVVAFPFRVAVFPLLSGVRVGFCVSDRTGTMATAEGEDCTGKNCPPPDSRLLLSFRQCGERTFLAVNLLPYFKTATILCVCVCVYIFEVKDTLCCRATFSWAYYTHECGKQQLQPFFFPKKAIMFCVCIFEVQSVYTQRLFCQRSFRHYDDAQ